MATPGNPICRWGLISFLLVFWAGGASAAARSSNSRSGWNTDSRLTVDSQGNARFALTTERIDLPVAKIAPSGQVVRSTYFGAFSGAAAPALGTAGGLGVRHYEPAVNLGVK